jgi:hypothetical protein
VYAQGPSTPDLVKGLRRGRCYVTESSAVTLALNAFRGDGASAGPGETLTVRPDTPLTITAEVAGATDSSLAIIRDGGCVGRVKTDGCGVAKLRWDCMAGEARFARVEVRRRARFPSMVAMSNPVWLQTN